MASPQPRHSVDDRALHVAFRVAVALVVDARHLLIPLGHDAHLLGRRTRAVFNEALRAHARGGELLAQPRARRVGADDADERRAAAKRRDVVRDVGRAPQTDVLGLELHDRDGSLGRNTRHAADDEAVEHHIACDEHGHTRESAHEITSADEEVAGSKLQVRSPGAKVHVSGGGYELETCDVRLGTWTL